MTTTFQKIAKDLKSLGVLPGDTIMMHSSFKSLGKVNGGAKTLFDAIFSVLGENGTLVMPAFSFNTVNSSNPHFNLKTSPSCVGYLPEYFRTQVDGVIRSMHPTHSCSAKGRLAKELTKDHYLDDTPVGKNSPLAKLPEFNGKILFLGCSTSRNTSMHGVEELSVPPYLYKPFKTEFFLDDGDGNISSLEHTTHFFMIDGQKYSQRYSRIEDLISADKIKRGKILEADCVIMDAKAVWEVGHAKLKENPFYFVEKI